MANTYRAYYPDETCMVADRLYDTPLIFSGLSFEGAVGRLPDRHTLTAVKLNASVGRFEYLTSNGRPLVVVRERSQST